MKPPAKRLLLSTHAALMYLYPPDFREEFGSEMRLTFRCAMEEAALTGSTALARLFVRELRDLPLVALHERIQIWGRPERPGGVDRPVEKLSRVEMLAALAVFLIPAGFILLKAAPVALVGEVVPGVMVLLFMMGAVGGLLRHLPRWSLPYFGLVLAAIVFLYLFQWEAERVATTLAARFVVQPDGDLGRLLLASFWEGVVWLGLLSLVAIVGLVLAALPRFRPLVVRLREDWTQLSYLLYGGATLVLVLTFDGYRYETPFALLALVCLAAGAWGYLQSPGKRSRLLALLTGITLAMAVNTVGKWIITPQQNAALLFLGRTAEQERWFEVRSTLFEWGWMAIAVALPALLTRLKSPPNHAEFGQVS